MAYGRNIRHNLAIRIRLRPSFRTTANVVTVASPDDDIFLFATVELELSFSVSPFVCFADQSCVGPAWRPA